MVSPSRSKPPGKSLLIWVVPKLKEDHKSGRVAVTIRAMLLVPRTFTYPAVAAKISNGFASVEDARTPKKTNMNIVITSSLERNASKA